MAQTTVNISTMCPFSIIEGLIEDFLEENVFWGMDILDREHEGYNILTKVIP